MPGHTYRVTVYYDNPTGRTLPDAGMGVVGGLFIPDGGAAWPPADNAEPAWNIDRSDPAASMTTRSSAADDSQGETALSGTGSDEPRATRLIADHAAERMNSTGALAMS